MDCGEVLACFYKRTDNKRLLLVTADEPTMLRYIINSPVFTEAQKRSAQSVLQQFMNEEAEGVLRPAPFQEAQHLFEAEGAVLYCAPNDSVSV